MPLVVVGKQQLAFWLLAANAPYTLLGSIAFCLRSTASQ
jgi:hypothetical protein